MSNSDLLPTLDEVKEIIDAEYEAIEKEILQTKKKEQEQKDKERIEQLQKTLSQ